MKNWATINEQKKLEATQFFESLCEKLKETHEVVKSCNQDFSAYLIPKGSLDQLSYYSKPKDSYRISDHWNWYSSEIRCSDLNMIQCENVNVAPTRNREEPTKATKPRVAIGVAYYGDDKKYHMIFGDVFNSTTRQYYWRTN